MKKPNESIKKVQSLDWDDSIEKKSIRRGYIAEKWFEIRQIPEKTKLRNSLRKYETQ